MRQKTCMKRGLTSTCQRYLRCSGGIQGRVGSVGGEDAVSSDPVRVDGGYLVVERLTLNPRIAVPLQMI